MQLKGWVYVYNLSSNTSEIVSNRPSHIIYHWFKLKCFTIRYTLSFIYPAIRCRVEHASAHIPGKRIFVASQIHCVAKADVVMHPYGGHSTFHRSVTFYAVRSENVASFSWQVDFKFFTGSAASCNFGSNFCVKQRRSPQRSFRCGLCCYVAGFSVR